MTRIVKNSGFINGPILLANSIYPPQLTANQNNYNPSGLSNCNTLFLDSSNNLSITGIAAQEQGRIIYIFNTSGSFNIKLTANDTGSLPANRFLMATDATLAKNESCIIIYDSVSLRWRLVARF